MLKMSTMPRLIAVALTALLGVIALSASALAQPGTPHLFYGSGLEAGDVVGLGDASATADASGEWSLTSTASVRAEVDENSFTLNGAAATATFSNLGASATDVELTLVPVVEEVMDEDAMGEDAMGEDAMGEDAMGEDAMGEDAMGEDAMGEDAMGEDAMGEDAMGEDAMGEDSMGDDEESMLDEDTTGEDAMDEDAMGEDAMGEDAMGEDAMGEDAMGEDAMGEDSMGEDSMGDDEESMLDEETHGYPGTGTGGLADSGGISAGLIGLLIAIGAVAITGLGLRRVRNRA